MRQNGDFARLHVRTATWMSETAQDGPKTAPRGLQEGCKRALRPIFVPSGFIVDFGTCPEHFLKMFLAFGYEFGCRFGTLVLDHRTGRARRPPGCAKKSMDFAMFFFSGLLASPLDLRENEYGFRNGFFKVAFLLENISTEKSIVISMLVFTVFSFHVLKNPCRACGGRVRQSHRAASAISPVAAWTGVLARWCQPRRRQPDHQNLPAGFFHSSPRRPLGA